MIRGVLAAAVLACPVLAASAQTSGTAEKAATPAFRSALDGFRPWSEGAGEATWRQVNDEVGRLQGHVGHLQRRAAGTSAPPPGPSAPPAPPAPASGGHHGHHKAMTK